MFVYYHRKGEGRKFGRDPRMFDDPNYKGPERRKKKRRRNILARGKSTDEAMHKHPGLTKRREQTIDRAISLLETQLLYKNLQEKASR